MSVKVYLVDGDTRLVLASSTKWAQGLLTNIRAAGLEVREEASDPLGVENARSESEVARVYKLIDQYQPGPAISYTEIKK